MMKLIHDFQPQLEPQLFHLMKQSIWYQYYPQCLKSSKILPLLKGKESPNLPNYFRPINIDQALAKVIDHVIFSQLLSHMQKH